MLIWVQFILSIVVIVYCFANRGKRNVNHGPLILLLAAVFVCMPTIMLINHLLT